jgi:8-oxo-dGTP pyrophosphatase MutT (NUDIX family)
MRTTHTLVYPVRTEEVCLGYKKLGFGAGYWNGFGGKIHDGETATEAAVRELAEECGLAAEASALTDVAHLTLRYPNELTVVMQVYLLHDWDGEIAETDEMHPDWFATDTLPLTEMWESDTAWLPRVLAGERLVGEVQFADDGTSVLSQHYIPLAS